MAQRNSTLILVTLLLLVLAAGIGIWTFQNNSSSAVGPLGSKPAVDDATQRDARVEESGGKTSRDSSSAEAASLAGASTPLDDSTLELLGELVTVGGRLLVEETGAPPVNAHISVRTQDDTLDNAYWIARVGGRALYDEMNSSGEFDRLCLAEGGKRATLRFRAAADGTFSLRVPKKAHRFTLDVVADDSCYQRVAWFYLTQETQEKGITVILNTTGALEGTLRSLKSEPVVDAHVIVQANLLSGPELPWVRVLQYTKTDKSGHYSFKSIPPGKVNIIVSAESFAVHLENEVDILAGATMTSDIRLEPEEPFEAQVVDANGKGVPDVSVRLFLEFSNIELVGFGFAKSDALGKLHFQGLVKGNYRVLMYSNAWRRIEGPESVTVPPTDLQNPVRWTVDPGHSLAGKVVDAQGKPVANVKITVSPWNDPAQPPPATPRTGWREVRTNADGTFRANAVPEGPLQVLVRLDNVSSVLKTGVAHNTENLEIQLPPATGVSGTVVDASTGAPLHQFVVAVMKKSDYDRQPMSRLWGFSGRAERPQASDSGSYEVGGLEVGSIMLRARAEGYSESAEQEVAVRAGELTPVSPIALVPGATVSGRVMDASTGLALKNAEVSLVREHETQNFVQPPAIVTNSEGRYQFKGQKPGEYRVTVYHEKHSESLSDVLNVRQGEKVEVPPIALGSGGSISGVALGRDGKPLPRAQMNVYYNDDRTNKKIRRGYRNMVADREGQFRFDGLESGIWSVSASPQADGRDWAKAQNQTLTAQVTVVEGQNVVVEFKVPKQGGCRVHGTVTRGGKPLTEGSVQSWSPPPSSETEASSDQRNRYSSISAKGTYELENVPFGNSTLNISIWGGASVNLSRQVEVPASVEWEYNIDLPAGSRLSGRVTRKSNGSPLGGISVQAYNYNDAQSGINAGTVTDDGGRYVIENAPAGKVTVRAEPQGVGFAWGSPVERTSNVVGRTVESKIEEGASTTLDFALDDGSSVLVEVVGSDGKPVPGAWVNLSMKQRPGEQIGYGQTDENGTAKIQGVPVGQVYANVSATSYASTNSAEFTTSLSGEVRIRVQLRKGVEVVLRVRGSDGQWIPIESVSLQDEHEQIVASAGGGSPDPAQNEGLKVVATPGSYLATFTFAGFKPLRQSIVIGEHAATVDVTVERLEPIKDK